VTALLACAEFARDRDHAPTLKNTKIGRATSVITSKPLVGCVDGFPGPNEPGLHAATNSPPDSIGFLRMYSATVASVPTRNRAMLTQSRKAGNTQTGKERLSSVEYVQICGFNQRLRELTRIGIDTGV
jgi:hypothetical protein